MAKGVALSHFNTTMEIEQATGLLSRALAIFKQIDDVRGVSACLLRMAGTRSSFTLVFNFLTLIWIVLNIYTGPHTCQSRKISP
jgi:hypothetical protein